MGTAVVHDLTLPMFCSNWVGFHPGGFAFVPCRRERPPRKMSSRSVIASRRLFELIEGVLVEKVMGYWESVLAIGVGGLLRDFLKGRKLGTLAGEAGMLRLSPGLVRIPDLSFISRCSTARTIAGIGAAILPLSPDLAVEVLGEGNTPREMGEK